MGAFLERDLYVPMQSFKEVEDGGGAGLDDGFHH
jgi:hypothetical protein